MVDWATVAVSGGVTAVGCGLLFWRQVSVINAVVSVKLAQLKESDGTMSAEMKETARILSAAATELKILATEQAVVNKVTAHALQGIVSRLDEHSKQITEQGTTLALMREFLASVHGKKRELTAATD